MTPSEQLALKNAILADPTFNTLPPGNTSALQIANELNLPSSPAFIVWKTAVSMDEIMGNGMDWARCDNLSIGRARIWDWLWRLKDSQGNVGVFNASKPNIRAGIDATWNQAADASVKAVIYTHCKRTANKVEKLLATGTGTDLSPGTMTFEGSLAYLDVVLAMGWPY